MLDKIDNSNNLILGIFKITSSDPFNIFPASCNFHLPSSFDYFSPLQFFLGSFQGDFTSSYQYPPQLYFNISPSKILPLVPFNILVHLPGSSRKQAV